MRRIVMPLAVTALALTACNENTALGNDRAAQVDPAHAPAPIMLADSALANVSTALIKPETMSHADIAALGGLDGRCAVRLSEVAFPSFLYEPQGAGAIKLNGKLILLPQVAEGQFVDGGLSVALLPREEGGEEELRAVDMIVVPPGAGDELGYASFVQCHEGEEE